MKAVLCLLVLVACAYAAEEKKTEKRGVVGLGYGLGGLGHGAAVWPGYSGYGGYGGYYGHGLGLYNQGLYGHGLLGHGVVAPAAPLVGHAAPLVGHAAPWGVGAPLLGLGHGWH